MRVFSELNFKTLRAAAAALLASCAALGFSSCSDGESAVAVLWTDRPEFAFYAELFNATQDRYRVEVYHRDFPARAVRDARKPPDIVVASWLRGAETRAFFAPLDDLVYGEGALEYAFYSGLLAGGNFGGTQYLLPVSFNAPLAVFARGNSPALSGPLAVGLEEMKALGQNFNARAAGAFTRMGFSPTWDDDFLFVMATLLGASFAEANPVAWDSGALAGAGDFAREWIAGANMGVQDSGHFEFRFFTIPPESMILSGRIFFAYMDSARFFTIAEDRRRGLDFRWIAERDAIPVAESAVYLGIAQGSRSPAADAFVRWFFRADTQLALLERSHKFRQMETSFGVAGGFSALRAVTEQFFPGFYPELLGALPPEDFFVPANALPSDWAAMKRQVVVPYLRERAEGAADATIPLESRVADWARLNRF